jgi:hypothetical protein
MHLCTHRHYLADSPVSSSPLTQSELYPRSGKHPEVRILKKRAQIFYKDAKLQMGMKAHVGSYGNLLQLKGDRFERTKSRPIHHPGNAKLYDSILEYKNNLCDQVVFAFQNQCHQPFITVNHWNDYPCVMVYIPYKSVHKAEDTTAPSGPAFENWVDFILSYVIGLLNFSAWQRNLHIETERRGGFGFSLPTGAPTNASFRISMGIVPWDYVKLLVDTLVILNNLLNKLAHDKLKLPPVPEDNFYGSKEHQRYLNKKSKPVELHDLVELLWAQVEKGGQRTVQNIMRTAYARDGIAQATFNFCYKEKSIKPIQTFYHVLQWATQRIQAGSTLKFKTKSELEYPTQFKQEASSCDDPQFWRLIKLICKKIATLEDAQVKSCLEKITECERKKDLQNLYFYLDLLHEAIFMNAMEQANEDYGDGYGSDSDTEEEINGVDILAKKVVTHSGMRAIWAAIIAVNSIAEDDLHVYLQNAYYETPLGLTMIECLNELNSITIVTKKSEANVFIHDLNACVTTGYNSKEDLKAVNFNKKTAYIILDATSATSAQVHSHLFLLTRKHAPQCLLVAESGFKNQQLGGDKNPHGIVRIFSIDKELLDKLYKQIKKSEKPLLSPTAHRYRHQMKFFGATLSNKAILSNPVGYQNANKITLG